MAVSIGFGVGPFRVSKRLGRSRRRLTSNQDLFQGALSGASTLNRLLFGLVALAASPLILAWLAVRSAVGRRVLLAAVVVPAAFVAAVCTLVTRRNVDHAIRVFRHVARAVIR